MFPLALIRSFGVTTGLPASTYAFASAVSLAMYPLAAKVATRRGARLVLRAGSAARAVAITILAIDFLSPVDECPLAPAGSGVLVTAWPILGAAARRSPRSSHRAKG